MDFKKILPIAVVGVAVIVLVIYAAFRPASTPPVSQIPSQVPGAANTGVPQPAASTGAQPGAASTPPASADPVSSKEPATIVPAGTNLKQYCEKYYTAWKSSDWQTAYDMQPVQKKSQNDVNGFTQSLQSYGMQTYEIAEPQINGNVGTVAVQLNLGQNGIWVTNWTFIKNDKGQWTVQDSKSGMSQ